MLNAISLVQDLNSSRRVHFPTTITTTPRAPPVIIIGVPNFDECVGPTTITSTIRTGVHGVLILQSTLESAVFKGFIIYFCSPRKFFYMRIVC